LWSPRSYLLFCPLKCQTAQALSIDPTNGHIIELLNLALESNTFKGVSTPPTTAVSESDNGAYAQVLRNVHENPVMWAPPAFERSRERQGIDVGIEGESDMSVG